MPLKVDTIIANTVSSSVVSSSSNVLKSTMLEVDNSFSYTASTVFSSFQKSGELEKPSGSLNVYTLKSQMEMLETEELEDYYFVFLGTLTSNSDVKISKIKGSFNNIPDFIASLSMPYSYGSFVEDAESPGDIYLIDFAGVDVIQISSTEYVVGAQFFTQNSGENFIAYVDLDIELTSETEITFSNIIPSIL